MSNKNTTLMICFPSTNIPNSLEEQTYSYAVSSSFPHIQSHATGTVHTPDSPLELQFPFLSMHPE